jgi:hypothetical protein
MNFDRQRLALVCAGIFSASVACAQETGAPTGTPAGAPATDTGATGAPVTVTAPPGAAPGTGIPGSTPLGAEIPGASPAATQAPPKPAPATPLSLGGGYGFVPQTLTPGEGRLAKPRIRFTLSISTGVDDNVFSAPDEKAPQGFILVTPPGVASVSVPASLGVIGPPVLVSFPTASGQIVSFFVTPPPTGASPATTRKVETPAVLRPAPPPAGRVASMVTTTNLGAQVQFASPRTVFTMDLGLSGIYYSNRPGLEPVDYNGNFNLLYLHKLTPRAQFNAAVDLAYLSQPDFSRVNAPTRGGTGNYLNGSSRFDLSYQWSARFSTVTSYSASTTFYEKATQAGSNYIENTFGNQVKFLLSPRTTFAGEYRYSSTSYDDPIRDSETSYFLGGIDLQMSRRFTSSTRLGEQVRSFQMGGASSSSPYLESALTYQYGGGASSLQWTNRYGFEESGSATQQRVAYRSGIKVNQVFSPRLQMSAGLNYVHNTSSTTGTNIVATKEDDLDATVGVTYLFSQHLSFTGNYTFTSVVSSAPFTSYNRNRASFGVSYSF